MYMFGCCTAFCSTVTVFIKNMISKWQNLFLIISQSNCLAILIFNNYSCSINSFTFSLAGSFNSFILVFSNSCSNTCFTSFTALICTVNVCGSRTAVVSPCELSFKLVFMLIQHIFIISSIISFIPDFLLLSCFCFSTYLILNTSLCLFNSLRFCLSINHIMNYRFNSIAIILLLKVSFQTVSDLLTELLIQ